MHLEDHVGDILSKARDSAGVPPGEAAAAAGLALDDYARLERDGRTEGVVDYRALGALLGLRGDCLERIADGWEPAEPDLGRWKHLRQVTTARGMAVNCYLVWDGTTWEAALFDTGWEAGPIEALLAEHTLTLRHLFITHGHGDHVAAADPIRKRHPGVEVHRGGGLTHSGSGGVRLGRLHIAARPTPGHAADGMTYVVTGWPGGAPPVAVVGDALFAGSVGGSGKEWLVARQAIQEQVLSLDAATLVCPGHGPVTTVGEEARNNPFFG